MYVLEASAAMTTLAEIFTQLMTWIGSLVTTISSNPLLMLGLGIWVVGGVIGLTSRLIGH